MTMLSEINTGDNPSVTSFVGASAAPSHAPAVIPQSMPTPCSVRSRRGSIATGAETLALGSGDVALKKSSAI
jgi:hypothetical protein